MKESKLIEMQNRIANLEAILRQLIPEINNIKDLSVGVFETIKLMPKYDKAINILKQRSEEKNEKKFETDVE